MKCPACGSEKIKTVSEMDDAGDIQKVICAEDDCGYIHSSEILVERADGSKMRKPQRIKPEDQPVSFDFAAKGGGGMQSPEEHIMSAEEMLELAIRTREETVGKAAREIVRDILAACAEKVLEGEHEYLITEDDAPPGEVFSLALKELRAKGYRVKKTPEPGKGTWIQVKWPTNRRGRKKKKPQKEVQTDEQLTFKEKKTPKAKGTSADPEMTAKQKAAAAHRKKAMKARSKSPT